MENAPKVFVSHASEDKERFVMDFAHKLRSNGVDAWLDKWEMKPGDSLITKIFEEGIKNAKAVIVVLSRYSVEKPWVKHELDAACVKRINSGSKLIPVVIDDCEVPEVLQATLWEKISDTSSYQQNFDRILASIFGASDKPALGAPPSFVSSFGIGVGTFNNVDSFVCKSACEFALRSGSKQIELAAFCNDDGFIVPEGELKNSIEYLGEYGTFELKHHLGGGFPLIFISDSGFELYAREHVENYSSVFQSVVSHIVNNHLLMLSHIKSKLDVNPFLIEHIIRILEGAGEIKVSWFLSGDCSIDWVSQSLRRSLR
ncbi:toll/interleukin-1 receptor domain-containing protein [Ectopseudomonas mendocina]|uniref:Toll/interleukin-1 receptor domain-containing protein n=1 Tax=Ectopseudomonas mendocina TaxID=300 RepID=A0ABZ2RNV2_ECTME